MIKNTTKLFIFMVIFTLMINFSLSEVYLTETFDTNSNDCTTLNNFYSGTCSVSDGWLNISNSDTTSYTRIELNTPIISGSTRPTFTISYDTNYYNFNALTSHFIGGYEHTPPTTNVESIGSMFFSSNTSLFINSVATNYTRIDFLDNIKHVDIVYNSTDSKVYWFIDSNFIYSHNIVNSNLRDFTDLIFKGYNYLLVDNIIIQDGIHINEDLQTETETTQLYKDLILYHDFNKYSFYNNIAVFEDSTYNEYNLKPIFNTDEKIKIISDNENCSIGLCAYTDLSSGKLEFTKKLPYLGRGFTIYMLAHFDNGATSTEPQFTINLFNDNSILIKDSDYDSNTQYIKTTVTDVIGSDYNIYSNDKYNTFENEEFIIITYDYDNRLIKMYRNNNLISSKLFSSDIKDVGDFNKDFITFTDGIKFDSFAVWKRPLTDYEISTIYNNGNFLDILKYIELYEDRSIPTVIDTTLYDYLYFESFDYDDNTILTDTTYSYTGNSDEIYILDDNMVFNVSADVIPYFKYDIEYEKFDIPTYANLNIYFELKNLTYIDNSLTGKPAVFKFEQFNTFDKSYINFNIAFDRYNDNTFQGVFYSTVDGVEQTFQTSFLKTNEKIIVNVLVDYINNKYTIKFFNSQNAFLGEFGGITRDFDFITNDLGYFEFGRIDYNDNITASEYITVDIMSYNLFDQTLSTGDSDFIDDSFDTVTEPITLNESIVQSNIKDSIKNCVSSLGFRGETGRLVFVFLFIIITMFAIAKIKSDTMDFTTKGLMITISTLLTVIISWKLELLTTEIFTFIIFIVVVAGAFFLRKLYSGGGSE